MIFESITDIGKVRTKNQDAYAVLNNQKGDFLAFVCDGIGGNKAGEVASFETMNYFKENFFLNNGFNNLEDAKIYLQFHLKQVNHHILELAKNNEDYEGMGTTISGILFTSFGNLLFNIGDSRCYGYNNELIQMSEDDSFVAELYRCGKISYEETLTHPKRHYLTKAIGIYEPLEVKVTKVNKYPLYLICTDGLHGYVSKEHISRILKETKPLKDKANNLKDAALLTGGYDNITFILAEDESWQN